MRPNAAPQGRSNPPAQAATQEAGPVGAAPVWGMVYGAHRQQEPEERFDSYHPSQEWKE